MEENARRWTWSRLVWLAPVAFGVLFLLLMVTLAGGFEPFLFTIAVIVLITGYVGRRFPRRAGPITVLVVMALLVLLNLPNLVDDLGHPDSFLNFAVFGVITLGFAVTAIIAAIAALRSHGDGNATRYANAVIGVMVIGVAFSAVVSLGVEDDTASPGDLVLVAEEAEYSPETLSGSGDVAVFVENKDPVRHTFTIEALDLEVNIPAGTNRRVEIDAPPGEYEYVCKVPGHDNMRGTLTISG